MSNLEELMKKYPISENINDYDLRDVKYKDVLNSQSKKHKWENKDILLEEIINYSRYSQGNTGTCTSCATAMLVSQLMKTPKNLDDMVSVKWINSHRNDVSAVYTGLNPRVAAKSVTKTGVIQFKDFSGYSDYPGVVREMESLEDLEELNKIAENHKLEAFVTLEKEEVNQWLNTRRTGLLVVLKCGENFYDALKNNGEFPEEDEGKCIGSHCMEIVGDKNGYFYLINSWGDNGDNNKLFRIKNTTDTILLIIGFTDAEEVKPFLNRNKTIEKWIKIPPKNPREKTRWKYIKSNGNYACDEWIKVSEKWYYINHDGYAIDGNWILLNGIWYYLKADSCEMAIEWNLINNKWYYFDNDGHMFKGWKCIKNIWYYLDADKGHAYCNRWACINDKWYHFDTNCHMQKGWFKDNDGRWYYLDETGAMKTGWFKDTDGKWYYLQENSDGYRGSMYKDGTYTINNKKYKFDEHGVWIEDFGVSDNLVNFIKGYEGYFNHWYNAGDGYDTIGYGTATSGKVGQRLKSQGIISCTESQATAWLKEEINNMTSSIKDKLNAFGKTLTQNQFDALASFAYNCGTASLFGSTLWKYVINGNSANDIQTAFLMWNKCNGRSLEGLTKRRQAEADMYNYGVYNSNH